MAAQERDVPVDVHDLFVGRQLEDLLDKPLDQGLRASRGCVPGHDVAHAADLGLTFYTGKMFPKKYKGGIFSAQHGSWNRTNPVGARIMFTQINEDGTNGPTEVFAEGWLLDTGEYAGRPVSVTQMADGSLLVSDDLVGAIYRISYGN